jgi:thiosulfate dehydrogenase
LPHFARCRIGWENVDYRPASRCGRAGDEFEWREEQKDMLKGLIVGIVLGVLLVAGGVYFYFSSGRAPVATSAPPMPFEKNFARIGLHAYLDKLPHPEPQVPADEANLLAGAKIYKENCAVCHGLPGDPKNAIAQGMYPAPPQLFHGVGVTDDDAWESYWKVENGIRMSGMPGFKDRLTEPQIWQVSVLVKNADKMPQSVRGELSSVPPTGAMQAAPASTPAPAKK